MNDTQDPMLVAILQSDIIKLTALVDSLRKDIAAGLEREKKLYDEILELRPF